MNKTAVEQEDESRLWERFCKGNKEAFDSLYYTYFPLLFQYCSKFTADRDLIKDVLQDFFIELFTQSSRRGNIRQLKSYLFVSARRKLLKTLRQQKVRSTLNLEEEDAYDFHLELSADHPLIHKQQDSHLQLVVQQVINQLSNRQREAVYLYFFENIGYDGIADIMSMKEVKYARTLIYRALAEMREAFAGNQQLSGLLES
ncbi:RNA polymerase sigma factor [Chitinophaga vietnamensis]|uniref:RNA polymerase sigma factor n=1 Tax=Chitinophaga vietnamensis TaxID=2593957 RepID=UPI0011783851|nr:RNA polymerase sigma factor [Chitinophaga vietnamensis]